MKGYKKYSKFIATVMLAAFLLPQIAWAQPYPDLRKGEVGTIGDIFIDGLRVDDSSTILNYAFTDGHIMVLLEMYTDFLGYDMNYDENSGSVIVSEDGIEKWRLHVDSKTYYSDGKEKQLTHPVCVYENENKFVYVPLELIVNELNATVKWNGYSEQEYKNKYPYFETPLFVNGIAMDSSSQIRLYTANSEKEDLWGKYNTDSWAKGMWYIIMKTNGLDPANVYLKPGEMASQDALGWGYQLLYSYSTFNREDAIDTLTWLALQGHRLDFAMDAEMFKSLSKEEYNDWLAAAEGMDKYMIPYTMELANKWGDRGILCWDMFRLSHVACWAYHAGYITKGEALDYIEVAANVVKENFSSWDEAVDNYLDGYAWWGRIDVSQENSKYHKRYQIYKNAKADATTAKMYFNDALFQQAVVGRAKNIITCYIDNQFIQIRDDEGKIYVDENSRTMVPLRTLAEAMNFTVKWDAADKSITIENGPKGTVVFYMGSKAYTINGTSYNMDTTAVSLPPGRIHVPLRYVAESLEAEVHATKTAEGMRVDIETK